MIKSKCGGRRTRRAGYSRGEKLVRVIAGKCRGMKLITPGGDGTRPTLDRVKEPVFSMLMPYVPGACVLDLFAGSGALGIEALSRGAEYCYFNDADRECVRVIEANLKHTGLEDRGSVMNENYVSALKILKKAGRRFNIVLLDPPYTSNYYENVILLCSGYGLLSPGCVIMCEHGREDRLPDALGPAVLIKDKGYGTVGVSIYRFDGDRENP